MVRKAISLAVFILIFFASTVAKAESREPLQFYDKERNTYSAAPGIASEIDISVNGTIARTQVIQYFANDTEQWQEGIYSFPLPDDAAVDHLVMVIGGRRVLGFVAEKEKARRIYERARQDGKAAGLVEEHRANIFRTSLANIPPRSLIAIEIGYQHEVKIDGQEFTMRVPLAITPRYDRFSPEEFLTLASSEGGAAARDVAERLALFSFRDGRNPVALRVTMQPGFETGLVESPSHRVIRQPGEDDSLEIATEEQILPGDQDFVLRWEPKEKGQPLAFLHHEKEGGQIFSHLVILPPQDGENAASARARAVTMIIDVSGSMDGPSIRQARTALIEALEDLSPRDSFNVISFQSVTESLFDAPVEATPENVAKAVKWVAGLEADGGTEMMPAVQKALTETYDRELLRQIVFITDGAVGYESELGAYIRDHVADARFFAVGIGAAPNAHLMRSIAMQGRGSFTFIGDIGETEKAMQALFAKMKTPIVTDISLDFAGIGEAEIIPGRIPDLMAGEPVTLAIRSPHLPSNIKLAGRRGGKDWSYRVRNVAAGQAEGIGKIYARRKVAELKFADPQGANPETARAITALGVEHQIVTEQTSLVAVDEKILRPEGENFVSVRHDPNLPKGWALARFEPAEAAQSYGLLKQKEAEEQDERSFHLPQTATGWQTFLFLGLCLWMCAAGLWVRGRTA